jgi:hypothetical protein
MTSHRVTLALVLVMVVVMLAAGCAGQQASGNLTANSTVNDNSSVLVTQTVQTRCPPQENTTHWIRINPIRHYYIGDVFEINGTTNIGINDSLSYWISKMPTLDRNGHYGDAIRGIVRTQNLDCNTTRWSFLINTTEFSPGDYDVVVGTENMTDADWNLFALADKNLKSI